MSDRWYVELNEDTKPGLWEFWTHQLPSESPNPDGDNLQFRVSAERIDNKRAEQICQGLNLTEAQSKKDPFPDGVPGPFDFCGTVNTPATPDPVVMVNRTDGPAMPGIDDLIFSEPGCCCCENTFGKRIKIYGMGEKDISLICSTCKAKYQLAKASSTAVRALEVINSLLANSSDDARWKEVKPIIQILIDLGKPVENLMDPDLVGLELKTRIDREREAFNDKSNTD